MIPETDEDAHVIVFPKCARTLLYKVQVKHSKIIHQSAIVAAQFCFPLKYYTSAVFCFQGTCCWKSVLSGCCATAGWGELPLSQKVVVWRLEASSIYVRGKTFQRDVAFQRKCCSSSDIIANVSQPDQPCCFNLVRNNLEPSCLGFCRVCLGFFFSSVGRAL